MTFSLAGRCARTGMMGAVITTSSPAVGSRCVFARAGRGVVLTQFWTDPRLGPRGLSLLQEGCGAAETLAALVASTPQREWRQVAVLDASGSSAHHSGTRTKDAFAGLSGEGCVAIGNILRNTEVPAAMVAAFEAGASLALPDRLLAALEAGDAAGGEEKALVSAGLLVVDTEAFPYVDLRADGSATPLADLRALWTLYAPHADIVRDRAVRPDTLV